MHNLRWSPQIIEGTLQTVCSRRPAEHTDQEEANVGRHKIQERHLGKTEAAKGRIETSQFRQNTILSPHSLWLSTYVLIHQK